MKKYLVITMSKSTREIRKEFVYDVEMHGTRIEEYIDSCKYVNVFSSSKIIV